MSFLERFRPQPKWKHADPAVRLAAVDELSVEDRPVLAALATDDPDPRVRRAAILSLADVAVLAGLAGSDPDEGVRGAAVSRLVEVVVQTTGPADAGAGLAAIVEPRQLVTIARQAVLEPVRLAAVSRLDDARLLGSVARHAPDPATRLQALERITDSAEVAVVALKSEHKDTALAALETIDDMDALKAIAGRARNKVAARRARAKLRLLEEQPKPPSSEELLAERFELCRRVEGLAVLTNADWVRDEVDAAELSWRELPGEVDTALAERFAKACLGVRDRLAKAEAERAAERTEDERRRLRIREAIAAGETLCGRLETVEVEHVPSVLADVEAGWASLADLDAPEATALAARYKRAVDTARARHAERETDQSRRARLEQIAVEAEAAVGQDDLGAARATLGALRRTWQEVRGDRAPDESIERRFRDASDRLSQREAKAREAAVRQQQENLAHLIRVCGQAEAAAQAADLSLKDAEHHLRAVRTAIEAPTELPSKHDEEEVLKRLRAVNAVLFPKVQELRQLDDWQRWANVAVQEELCAKTEALIGVTDIARAARELQEIRDKWKAASHAPRERAGDLWARFKAAHDQVRARCDAHFAEQSKERAACLERKRALCERAEALMHSTDWIKTAQELQTLQEEWKAIGPVPHKDAKAVWHRFRTACNAFFTRRHDDLVQRKEEWIANLAKKEALCQQAETLAESTDWEQTAVAIKQLQAEWKTVGPVKRNRSEAVWQRFRAACDRFFERYKQRDRIDRAASVAERETICEALERLVPPAGDAAEPGPAASSEDVAGALGELRVRWQAIGPSVAIPRVDHERLSARFAAALARLADAYPDVVRGTDLDVTANQRRMERLCERVERYVPKDDGADDRSPAATLARQLREALAANTIGGRVDEEAKWKAAAEDVKRAQAEWHHIGPVSEAVRRALSDRFHAACNAFFEERRAKGGVPRPHDDRHGARPPRPEARS